MVDLYLQAMLHGDFVNKPKQLKNSDSDIFDAAIEHFAKLYADSLPFESDPGHQMESVEMRRQKAIAQIKEDAKFRDAEPYLDLACSSIYSEGNEILGEETFAALEEELNAALEKIESINPMEPLSDELNSVLSLSDRALDGVLQIALTKYKMQQYEECFALFVFLTTISRDIPEYWVRLGIAAQKCERFDAALAAYGNALLLSPKNVGATLFAAECLLKLGQTEEAKRRAAIAQDLISQEPVDEVWSQFLETITAAVSQAPSSQMETS